MKKAKRLSKREQTELFDSLVKAGVPEKKAKEILSKASPEDFDKILKSVAGGRSIKNQLGLDHLGL